MQPGVLLRSKHFVKYTIDYNGIWNLITVFIVLPYRRRQRRLSGQVEELETNITDLLAAPLTDDDVDDFDLTTLRIEGEAELGAAIPSLSSYSLFNSAPYGNLG